MPAQFVPKRKKAKGAASKPELESEEPGTARKPEERRWRAPVYADRAAVAQAAREVEAVLGPQFLAKGSSEEARDAACKLGGLVEFLDRPSVALEGSSGGYALHIQGDMVRAARRPTPARPARATASGSLQMRLLPCAAVTICLAARACRVVLAARRCG